MDSDLRVRRSKQRPVRRQGRAGVPTIRPTSHGS